MHSSRMRTARTLTVVPVYGGGGGGGRWFNDLSFLCVCVCVGGCPVQGGGGPVQGGGCCPGGGGGPVQGVVVLSRGCGGPGRGGGRVRGGGGWLTSDHPPVTM